ncbi:hypothetical protein [Arthrobacter sp. S39]|uniref:hypothetical protein n=1 Tax=Arthrobacter sp. S39 TaxID=2509720 RepID=UPI001A947B50|nr:hypothetical protein [Arthrobacter sp. S39]
MAKITEDAASLLTGLDAHRLGSARPSHAIDSCFEPTQGASGAPNDAVPDNAPVAPMSASTTRLRRVTKPIAGPNPGQAGLPEPEE